MTTCTRIPACLAAMLVFLAPASIAATDEEVDNLFAWAEVKAPALLSPSGAPSQVAGGYRYRYYSGTRNYVGYRAADNQIYMLGANGAIVPLGDVTPYLALARVPPATAAEMPLYLGARAYSSWPSDPAVRPSASVHFGNVRTWTNPTLRASLAAGNMEHPAGSAAIKELYGDGTQRRGWAVMVRTRTGGGADGWYWYEVFDGFLVGEGQGAGQCTNCHSLGTDFSCQAPGSCTTPAGSSGW